MRFMVGTDDAVPVVEAIVTRLREKGHEVDSVVVKTWGDVALDVGRAVAEGRVDQGIVLCFTGTGVTMAANKVPGVRAALCVDAPTAAGARKWNDANVLAMSLRLLSETVAAEIVDAWLGEKYGRTEDESLHAMKEAETAKD